MMEDAPARWILVCAVAVVTIVVAGLGGWLTEVKGWYETLTFPRWRPPNWLFGPAWSAIYLCIGTSAVIAFEQASGSAERWVLIAAFAVNSVLAVLWSAFFFRWHRPDHALVDLVAMWLSIVVLVWLISRIDATAIWLMIPYLAWVTFAGILNWRIYVLNRPFGPDARPARPV